MLSYYQLYYNYSTKKSIVKQTIKNNKKQKKYYVIIEYGVVGMAVPHPYLLT